MQKKAPTTRRAPPCNNTSQIKDVATSKFLNKLFQFYTKSDLRNKYLSKKFYTFLRRYTLHYFLLDQAKLCVHFVIFALLFAAPLRYKYSLKQRYKD